jgi:hypothetical protein
VFVWLIAKTSFSFLCFVLLVGSVERTEVENNSAKMKEKRIKFWLSFQFSSVFVFVETLLQVSALLFGQAFAVLSPVSSIVFVSIKIKI